MSYNTGPKIINDGLIMHVDVANHKSWANRNVLSWNNWVAGASSVGGYSFNQDAAGENALVSGTDPWGNTNVVWETRASGNSNPDGGWNTDSFPVDISKKYRYSVWMKRTSSTTSGTFYLGCYGYIGRMDGGADEGNPYWHCANIGAYTQNVWYLFVGHVYPYGTPNRSSWDKDSGVYTISGGKISDLNGCNVGYDVRWLANQASNGHRTYHFYCSDNTSRMQLFQPRVDICDGTEPSIEALLNNDTGGRLTDLSGNNNHLIITGGPSYSDGKFTLNGSTQGFTRTSAMNNVTANNTVVIVYRTTDGQELWVRGNQDNGWYLSASSGNNYYHSNVGSPTNFVDLATVVRPDSPVNYRNGNYHMWEAKNVNFTAWTYFDWFLYPSNWQMAGDVAMIMVYNRYLSPGESRVNYEALKGRFNLP
jgi:hypothetical protein